MSDGLRRAAGYLMAVRQGQRAQLVDAVDVQAARASRDGACWLSGEVREAQWVGKTSGKCLRWTQTLPDGDQARLVGEKDSVLRFWTSRVTREARRALNTPRE